MIFLAFLLFVGACATITVAISSAYAFARKDGGDAFDFMMFVIFTLVSLFCLAGAWELKRQHQIEYERGPNLEQRYDIDVIDLPDDEHVEFIDDGKLCEGVYMKYEDDHYLVEYLTRCEQ